MLRKMSEMGIVKNDQKFWNVERRIFNGKSKWTHWAILEGKSEYYRNYEDKKEGSGVMEIERSLLWFIKEWGSRANDGVGSIINNKYKNYK